MAYDPKKAHERYLKYRQLKGRKKGKKKAKKVTEKSLTANFNEQQKAQALELKAQMNAQKKAFNKQLNALIKEKSNALKTTNMSEEEKAVEAERIRLQFGEAKKQAAAAFKAQYLSALAGIK